MISLEEAKEYLLVDFPDEDELIIQLISWAEELVKDAGRLSDEEFSSHGDAVRIAVYYAIGYLYEHREEADLHELTLMLRAILFGVRKEVF